MTRHVLRLVAWLLLAKVACAAQVKIQQVADVDFPVPPYGGYLPTFSAVGEFRGEFYFNASVGDGEETRLFKTDGKSISQFDPWTIVNGSVTSTIFRDHLYFAGYSEIGSELHRTDGINVEILDARWAAVAGDYHIFSNVEGRLYFPVRRSVGPDQDEYDVASTDGLEVRGLAPELKINPFTAFPIGGRLYYSAAGAMGRELYQLQDSELRLVADLNPGAGDSNPLPKGQLNGEVYFTATGPEGLGLYRTDGATTRRMTDLSGPITGLNGSRELTNLGGALYFAAFNGGTYRLFRTDGESVIRYELEPAVGPELWTVAAVIDEQVFVGGISEDKGAIFVIDKSGHITNRLFVDSPPLPADPVLAGMQKREMAPAGLTQANGLMYFGGLGLHGRDLFATDGEQLVEVDVVPDDLPSYRKYAWTPDAKVLNGTLFVSAMTSAGGELVLVDELTTRTIDVVPGAGGSQASRLEIVGDQIVFMSSDDIRGERRNTAVYSTDGTDVTKLMEFPTIFDELSNVPWPYPAVTEFARWGDDLYFLARTDEGFRLFRIHAVPEPASAELVGLVLVAFAGAALSSFRGARR